MLGKWLTFLLCDRVNVFAVFSVTISVDVIHYLHMWDTFRCFFSLELIKPSSAGLRLLRAGSGRCICHFLNGFIVSTNKNNTCALAYDQNGRIYLKCDDFVIKRHVECHFTKPNLFERLNTLHNFRQRQTQWAILFHQPELKPKQLACHFSLLLVRKMPFHPRLTDQILKQLLLTI